MTDEQTQRMSNWRPEYGAMRGDFESTQRMAPIAAQMAVPMPGVAGVAGGASAGTYAGAHQVAGRAQSNAGEAAGAADGVDINADMNIAVKKKSHKGLIITLIVAAVLLAALIGAFFTARWYFADRVAPGVHFGAVDVTGQTSDELTATVTKAVKDSAITVNDVTSGNKVTASLENLGVDVDVEATVKDLLNAKSSSNLLEDVVRVNPLSTVSVPLKATTNDFQLSDYLSSKLIDESGRAVPSSIAYNAETKAFAATEGRSGSTPQTAKVQAAVRNAVAEPGTAATVSVKDETIETPISLATAQQAADQANQRLSNKIVMTNGDSKQFTLPVDEVAKWIEPTGEPSKGEITLSYDTTAIKQYLEQQLPAQLNQDMVSQVDIVDGNGTVVIKAQTKGVNGVVVKDTDAAATQVVSALEKGQGGTVQVAADVTKYDTKQKKSEYRLVVDKSSQTVTVYQNGSLIKTFNVVTGKASTQTDNGTFYVYLKYQTQTMRGEDYVTPNVRWVTYFNGGEGFHAAPWNYSAIAAGDPINHGSHGCVNMYEADANWIYTNIPDGAIVQVVGSNPTSPTR
ncbi:L,D-transpeptidase [Bifidobacterium sp. MA2]|uniref:L,D-transpeptidase n=1 Tax=Bifidobacterium santillanense TaxID=2809028 RepID=A0ABS5UPL7_9BIFI|nr:L,D-transpeptidase [Bifidobacterium santillanense]MBT1172856.1 L,D-transpeptidase [Bifidobacterium santillanense]